MTFESGIRVGKYVVGRKLGQGGFGVIHAAHDTELDREVAIKFLRPEHSFRPQIVQRFLQEARAAARINHPGIVTVHETGIVGGTNTRADGTVYIAMELLHGETLGQLLRRVHHVPLGFAIGIATQLASALSAAHASSIVHRDLKPQNIWLQPDDAVVGGERVKILDFGIAKLVDDFGSAVQTHSKMMLGTPMYMSPEQCKSSAKVDARSDIYALGCMLFELVCGRPPFEGDSGELIAMHQLVAPPTARSLDASIPVALDQLIAAMLAKSPDDRPPTMDAVLDALYPMAGSAEQPSFIETAPNVRALEPSTTLTEGAASREVPPWRARSRLFVGAAVAIAIGIGAGALAVRGGGTAEIAANPPAGGSTAIAPPPQQPIDAEQPATQPDAEQTPTDCDADKLAEKGSQDEATGQHAAAVAQFEQAYQCQADDRLLRLGFMAACNAGDAAVARHWYQRLPADNTRSYLAQMCLRAGIRQSQLDAPDCDADVLTNKGSSEEAIGHHLVALEHFEKAYKCRPSERLLWLGLAAACNSGNTAKAKLWFKRVPAGDTRSYLVQTCVRAGISPSALQ